VSPVILSVALNAALDVTYDVERLSHGEATRVRTVETRPGGKGVNVAAVLAALGDDVTLAGFAGGCRGQRLRELLADAGLNERFVAIAGESRQTVVAIAEDGAFAEYDEPGPEVSHAEWECLLALWPAMVDDCASVVLAGSLPPGVPPDAYQVLISAARERNRPVVFDAGGAALRAGVAAGPDVVKLNRAELSSFDGAVLVDDESVVEAASAVRTAGAGAVITTLGSDGAIALGDRWGYRIRQPERVGSPVGAGDAFTAGLVGAKASEPGRLAFAAALAASAVGLRGAGMVDLDVARRIVDDVEVTSL
jgi:tagatose 6-phosphate kinase